MDLSTKSTCAMMLYRAIFSRKCGFFDARDEPCPEARTSAECEPTGSEWGAPKGYFCSEERREHVSYTLADNIAVRVGTTQKIQISSSICGGAEAKATIRARTNGAAVRRRTCILWSPRDKPYAGTCRGGARSHASSRSSSCVRYSTHDPATGASRRPCTPSI